MQRNIFWLLFLWGTLVFAEEAGFWRCEAKDAAQMTFKADNALQKTALNKAYALCKKDSKYPESCQVAKTGCEFFAKGVNTSPLWECSALDRLSEIFTSNPYPNKYDAVVAARAYCQQQSKASDSCYVNLLTCKPIERE
ncbi:MAG: hypothetical protein A3F18_07250 [Legionellales bacterium RIFCSPHIGHO2_12_FULL_37_14]|nr:MAG: hypothetical protein A3F18_07250 [Legionellales bacterium RIFCSPHIGHO2_12_FULL_37_14]